MAEIKEMPAGLIMQRAMCSTCGEELTAEDKVLMSHPAQYPHVCKNGHRENLRKVYPTYKMYEVIDDGR